LVSLNPPTTLSFQLERGAQPRTVLRITNISDSKIVFKVKTTQPTWYYVRPNQQMLDIGQSEDVAILLIDTECAKFLDQPNAHNEKLEKHRFLVQGKVIEYSEFARISELHPQQRTDEFTKIWDGPKDDRKNIKLKVEFNFPESANGATAAPAPSTIVSGGVASESNDLRARLSAEANNSAPVARSREETSSSPFVTHSPDILFTELQSLRKKYDAVVEYTVHLTAERDAIVQQLETSQRELIKEKSKKKTGDASAAQSGSAVDTKKGGGEQGVSVFLVVLVAIIAFLVGKYLLH